MGATAEQFVSTNDALDKVKQNLQTQFDGTMKLMEGKVQLEIQNLFSAQSLENGFLWQNLINACNANFANAVQTHIEKAEKDLNARIHAKVAHVSAIWHGKLGEGTASLKAWFIQEMVGIDKSVGLRLVQVSKDQAGIRAAFTSMCQAQQGFESRLDQKLQAIDKNIASCLNGLHMVGQKVVSEDKSQGLAEIRQELNRVQRETVERAHLEGRLQEKVQILEKNVDRLHHPPCAPPATDNVDSAPALEPARAAPEQCTRMPPIPAGVQ